MDKDKRPPLESFMGKGFTKPSLESFGTPKKELPILTKESGGFRTALKDIAVGAGKGFLEGARGLAGLLQSGGQRIMAGIDPTKTYQETRAETGFKSLQDETPEGAGVAENLRAKSRGEQVGKVLGGAAEIATGFVAAKGPQLVTKTRQAYQASREAKATERVTEMIAPKPTAKEAKLAQSQGRFVEGKDPTFFRSGTPDTILPSQKTLSATETITTRIPNASKMQPSELYKAVDTEITRTAEALRPKMQATPIKPETIQKINDDWTTLKSQQIKVADATEEANVLKLQKQFEDRLTKSGNKSHDDLWQTRIDYDASVPDNVKKANSLSSESLQNKKEIWLQNRRILSDAIDATADGEMKAMSDLYEARNTLLSKTQVDKAQASKLKQLIKKHPEVAGVLKVVLGIEAFRRLTGVDLSP